MKLTINYKEKNDYIHSVYTTLFNLQRGHTLYLHNTLTYQLSDDTEENRQVLRSIYFDIVKQTNKQLYGVISVHLT